MERYLGKHIILEFYECPRECIQDSRKVEEAFMEAARVSRANIVKTVFHYFNPHGVSGVVVIAESHFSIHTWPEHGYCAIDLFTCSEDLDLKKAIEVLKERLKPKYVSAFEFKRGTFI